MQKSAALEEFKNICRGYYSVYVVANEGMSSLGKKMQMTEGFEPNEGYRIRDEDTGAVIAEEPNYRMQMGMSYNGPFSQIIAHGILNWIYAIWETRYREQVAKDYGCATKEIFSNVIGDIRILRNLISHEFAITNLSNHKFTVFTWIPNGPVVLQKRDMDRILMAINSLDVFVKTREHVGTQQGSVIPN